MLYPVIARILVMFGAATSFNFDDCFSSSKYLSVTKPTSKGVHCSEWIFELDKSKDENAVLTGNTK
jgi:hypothetical protein